MSASADKKIMSGCLLDLKMVEGTGTVTRDWSKTAHHPMTEGGAPAWGSISGLQYKDFNSATPDYLSCASASCTDLDFTSGLFSGNAWIYFDAISSTRTIFNRGLASTDGWAFYYDGNGTHIETYQAGALQGTYSLLAVTASTWYMLSFVRVSTTKFRLYYNGIDRTGIPDTHTNPLTSARNLYVSVNNALGNPFDGKLYRPRIWNRALTPEEIFYLWQTERRLFNV